MSNERITIIVPIYKVEQYLDKCLASIAAQTYHELEVLLIDDGSPDGSAAIAAAWAARDRRFRLIRQENGGLSAARNTGLDQADGAYIGFVDSDDWIEPEMFERLLAAIHAHDADIAVCGRDIITEDRVIVHTPEEPTVFESDEALRVLAEDGLIRNYAWDKLYRAALFDGIRFPEGRIFEDILTTYKLFEKASRVAVIEYLGYHYCRREGSISGGAEAKNDLSALGVLRERYQDIAARRPAFGPCFLEGYSQGITRLIRSFAKAEDAEQERMAERITAQELPFVESAPADYENARRDRAFLRDPIVFCEGVRYDAAAKNRRIIELKKERKRLEKKLRTLEQGGVRRLGRAVIRLPKKLKQLLIRQ